METKRTLSQCNTDFAHCGANVKSIVGCVFKTDNHLTTILRGLRPRTPAPRAMCEFGGIKCHEQCVSFWNYVFNLPICLAKRDERDEKDERDGDLYYRVPRAAAGSRERWDERDDGLYYRVPAVPEISWKTGKLKI